MPYLWRALNSNTCTLLLCWIWKLLAFKALAWRITSKRMDWYLQIAFSIPARFSPSFLGLQGSCRVPWHAGLPMRTITFILHSFWEPMSSFKLGSGIQKLPFQGSCLEVATGCMYGLVSSICYLLERPLYPTRVIVLIFPLLFPLLAFLQLRVGASSSGGMGAPAVSGKVSWAEGRKHTIKELPWRRRNSASKPVLSSAEYFETYCEAVSPV